MDINSDLAAIFSDMPDSMQIACGQSITRGIVDASDMHVIESGRATLQAKSILVTIRTGTLPVSNGAEIEVGSKRYIVRESVQLDDGRITQLLCANK